MNQRYSYSIFTFGVEAGFISQILSRENICFMLQHIRSSSHLRRKVSELKVDLVIYGPKVKSTDDLISDQQFRNLALIDQGSKRLEMFTKGFDDVELVNTPPLILRKKIINLLSMNCSIHNGALISNNSTLDLIKGNLILNGTSIRLNMMEIEIIKSLFQTERLIPPDKISSRLCKVSRREISLNNTRVIIHRLRNKIRTQSGFTYIKCKREGGYYLSF